jgi:polyferredoxin
MPGALAQELKDFAAKKFRALYDVVRITTAGAATYTPAQLKGGIIQRDCNGLSRSDVLPTAVLLVAYFKPKVNEVIPVTIINWSDAAETITVTAGSGGTVVGTATIAQNAVKVVYIRVTNVTSGSEAYVAHMGA